MAVIANISSLGYINAVLSSTLSIILSPSFATNGTSLVKHKQCSRTYISHPNVVKTAGNDDPVVISYSR